MALKEYVLDLIEKKGVWKTIRGQKVFIEEGETPKQALMRKVEYLKKPKPKVVNARQVRETTKMIAGPSPKAAILAKAKAKGKTPVVEEKTPKTMKDWKERARALKQALEYCRAHGDMLNLDIVSSEPQGVWKTIRGSKVYIRKGETITEAFKRRVDNPRYLIRYSTSDPAVRGLKPIPFSEMGQTATQEGETWGLMERQFENWLNKNPGKVLQAQVFEYSHQTDKYNLKQTRGPFTKLIKESADRLKKEYHKWKSWGRGQAVRGGKKKAYMMLLYRKFLAKRIGKKDMAELKSYAKRLGFKLTEPKRPIRISKKRPAVIKFGSSYIQFTAVPSAEGGYIAEFYESKKAMDKGEFFESEAINERDLEYWLWHTKRISSKSKTGAAKARYRVYSKGKSAEHQESLYGGYHGWDLEVADSFMDLVTWVMSNMNITDEEEAKKVAWKIINSKRGKKKSTGGKGKAKPKPKPKPKETPQDKLEKQIGAFREEYKLLKDAFERANDFDEKVSILGRLAKLANEMTTFEKEHFGDIDKKSNFWMYRYDINQLIPKFQKEIDKWYQEEVDERADERAEKQLANEDKHYWDILQEGIREREKWSLIAELRAEKAKLEAKKKRYKEAGEYWGLHERRELKRAKDEYNDMVRKDALQRHLLIIKAPARFEFDKKALMFTKSSKNRKANIAYLNETIKDWKMIPPRFRDGDIKYTKNANNKIKFIWKCKRIWGGNSQNTGGQYSPGNGMVEIATVRKLREAFTDSVMAHEIGHAVHYALEVENPMAWGALGDIYNSYKDQIREYGDAAIYNQAEFFANLFMEYTTGKVRRRGKYQLRTSGQAYQMFVNTELSKRPKLDRYFIQSYPKAYEWLKKTFGTKGFKGIAIINKYKKDVHI